MPKFDLISPAAAPLAKPAAPPVPAPVEAAPAAPPVEAAPVRRRATRSKTESKRRSRKLSGFYLTAETMAKLKRHVFERQAAGEKVDASDVVEQALKRLLK